MNANDAVTLHRELSKALYHLKKAMIDTDVVFSRAGVVRWIEDFRYSTARLLEEINDTLEQERLK